MSAPSGNFGRGDVAESQRRATAESEPTTLTQAQVGGRFECLAANDSLLAHDLL